MSNQSQPTLEQRAAAISGTAFGLSIALEADSPWLLERMLAYLPPTWRDGPPQEDAARFTIASDDGLEYELRRDDVTLTQAELDVALGVFDAQLRGYIALNAPGRIFVHAGVVTWGERALMIPGRSFSGKTSLVASLVRAGATYYSDEYAVLDEDGLVHPYPKTLSLRLEPGSRLQTEHTVEQLGGAAGNEAAPVHLIVVTQYRTDGVWSPQELSGGDAALELSAHTIPIQERPQESLAAIRGAVEGATTLRGERGDAEALVPLLLDYLK